MGRPCESVPVVRYLFRHDHDPDVVSNRERIRDELPAPCDERSAWMSSSAHPTPHSSARRRWHFFLAGEKCEKLNQEAPPQCLTQLPMSDPPRKKLMNPVLGQTKKTFTTTSCWILSWEETLKTFTSHPGQAVKSVDSNTSPKMTTECCCCCFGKVLTKMECACPQTHHDDATVSETN